MIPANTVLTFDVVGTTDVTFGTSPSVVRGIVVGALQPYFDAYTVDLIVPGVLSDLLSFDWVNTPYSAVVTLQTRASYADVDDVGSVIANAFYQAVSALPTVTARNSGEPTPGSGIVTSGPGIGDALSGVFAGLQTTTIVLIVGIVGLAYVLANGRNVGALARLV